MNLLGNWKIILSLAAIFVAGGVTGSFVSLRTEKRHPPRHFTSHGWVDGQCLRLHRQLDLTPDQQKAIRAILDHAATQLKLIRSNTIAQTFETMHHAFAKVEDELTPQQRVKFERIRKERRERFHRRFKFLPPPHPRSHRP